MCSHLPNPLPANLELGENKLQGSIPDVIYNLKNLSQLSLDQNLFTGTISPLIGKMSKLEILELYENQLTGKLPDSLFSLEALKKIRVGGNKLSGTIPSKMEFLNNTLTEFKAENTLLTGTFPNALVLSLPYLSESSHL
jgi:Leucine-rich repeat (LRR) protein